jgi:SAM-dependent methyltransferase
MLPFSEACERNKQPILEVLARHIPANARVLEIGSGTGQHAVHFSRHLPKVAWQPSDQAEYLPGLLARAEVEGGPNLRRPIELDVSRPADWPAPGEFDAVFTANTLHIMSWQQVVALMRSAGRLLTAVPAAFLLVYGPFRYDGRLTTASNEAFDRMLKGRDPASGLRAFEEVDAEAASAGFTLVEDCAMPANNQMLVWRKSAP